jgi:hypothetical protein
LISRFIFPVPVMSFTSKAILSPRLFFVNYL